MSFERLLQDLHCQHVLINGAAGFITDAGDLKLIESDLAMSGLEGDT